MVERGGDVARGLIVPIEGLEPEEISDDDEPASAAAAKAAAERAEAETKPSAGAKPKGADAKPAAAGGGEPGDDSDDDPPEGAEEAEGAKAAAADDVVLEDDGQDLALVEQMERRGRRAQALADADTDKGKIKDAAAFARGYNARRGSGVQGPKGASALAAEEMLIAHSWGKIAQPDGMAQLDLDTFEDVIEGPACSSRIAGRQRRSPRCRATRCATYSLADVLAWWRERNALDAARAAAGVAGAARAAAQGAREGADRRARVQGVADAALGADPARQRTKPR